MLDIVVIVLVSCLLLALSHYLPWRGILRRDLPILARYTIGVLSIAIPMSVYWVACKDWNNLVMLWSVILFSGLTVYLLYVLDTTIEAHGRADIAEEEGRQLRGKANKRG